MDKTEVWLLTFAKANNGKNKNSNPGIKPVTSGLYSIQRAIGNQQVGQMIAALSIGRGMLQRKCACGGSDNEGECEECKTKRMKVQQLGATNNLQTKLVVGSSTSIYEKEADEMAEKVMRMKIPEPDSIVRSKKIKEGKSQRKEYGEEIYPDAFSLVNEVINSPGKPLDKENREFFEPRFGYDFSNVRIHDDNKATKSAIAVNALAYIYSNHIVFAKEIYQHNTKPRLRLLAHELTHTIQQNSHPNPVIHRKPITKFQNCATLG